MERAASVPTLPEKATTEAEKASGRGRYVPMPARFGKGRSLTFEDFVTAKPPKSQPPKPKTAQKRCPCHKFHKGPAFGPKTRSLGPRERMEDGQFRFCRRGRRLRRLRGGKPPLGGSRDLCGAVGGRWHRRQLGGDDPRRADSDGCRQGQQLGFQHGAV